MCNEIHEHTNGTATHTQNGQSWAHEYEKELKDTEWTRATNIRQRAIEEHQRITTDFIYKRHALEAQIADKDARYNELLGDYDRLEEKYTKLQQQIAELKATISNYQNDLESEHASYESLEESYESLEDNYTLARNEIASLQRDHELLAADRDKLQEQLGLNMRAAVEYAQQVKKMEKHFREIERGLNYIINQEKTPPWISGALQMLVCMYKKELEQKG